MFLWNGFKIKPSTRKYAKYKVFYDGKWIHFGHKGYDDYTQHEDNKRRESFIKRASKIKSKGKYARDNPFSPLYWSMRVLWDYDPVRDAHLVQ